MTATSTPTAGADELRGGAGNDVFQFYPGEAKNTGPDQVVDFQGAGVAGGDTIRLLQALGATFIGYRDIGLEEGDPLPEEGSREVMYTFDGESTYVVCDYVDDAQLGDLDITIRFPGELQFIASDFVFP